MTTPTATATTDVQDTPTPPRLVVDLSRLADLIADVIPFAGTDPDLPTLHAVDLHWDGTTLHAAATDRYRIGWSRLPIPMHPDDPRPAWHTTVDLADARHLVDMCALASHGCLSVDTCNRLTVHLVGNIALTATFPTTHRFPTWRDHFNDLTEHRTTTVAINPDLIADFAKVHNHGNPMRLDYTTHHDGPRIRIRIGDHFTGLLMPIRD